MAVWCKTRIPFTINVIHCLSSPLGKPVVSALSKAWGPWPRAVLQICQIVCTWPSIPLRNVAPHFFFFTSFRVNSNDYWQVFCFYHKTRQKAGAETLSQYLLTELKLHAKTRIKLRNRSDMPSLRWTPLYILLCTWFCWLFLSAKLAALCRSKMTCWLWLAHHLSDSMSRK